MSEMATPAAIDRPPLARSDEKEGLFKGGDQVLFAIAHRGPNLAVISQCTERLLLESCGSSVVEKGGRIRSVFDRWNTRQTEIVRAAGVTTGILLCR